MAITIKSITKASDDRQRITVEDSAQIIDTIEGVDIYKTYSFYVQDNLPEEEKAVGAKLRLEKAISEDKKKTFDANALKQVYAVELAKVDPSKVEVISHG